MKENETTDLFFYGSLAARTTSYLFLLEGSIFNFTIAKFVSLGF